MTGIPETWNGPCPRCGAVEWGKWPHPAGAPCPLIVDEHEREQERRDLANEAYIASLDAQRNASIRQGVSFERSATAAEHMARRMAGDEEVPA